MPTFYKTVHCYLCLQLQDLVLIHLEEQNYTIFGTDNCKGNCGRAGRGAECGAERGTSRGSKGD